MKRRFGVSRKPLKLLSAWPILFFSKFIFIWVLDLLFHDNIHINGFFGILLVVALVTTIQRLAYYVFRRLGDSTKQLIKKPSMTSKAGQDTRKISFRIGVALLITAGLLWLDIVAVPFLPIETSTKVRVVGVLLVAGEVAFWMGVALTGKEFFARYKQHLDPRNWRRKR